VPLTDLAYFDGEDRPRCTFTPDTDDIAGNPLLRRGAWECTLPVGHEQYDNPRHHPHAWVQTGEE